MPPAGTYHVGPDGAYRLTSGQVIALGSQKLLATDCGENLTCGLVVVDRATGEATPLTPTLLEPTTEVTSPFFDNPANYGFPTLMSSVSPDNRYAPIIMNGPDQDYGVIDLTTGEFIQFGDYPESALWWSPDSAERDVPRQRPPHGLRLQRAGQLRGVAGRVPPAGVHGAAVADSFS